MKGAIRVAFVRPSVAYIANNSRTQRPSMLKYGRKVPILDATHVPVSRSNGQRSGLEAGFQAFSFLCTFVPGSEKTIERTFAPVELSFLRSEGSKNFRSYETVLS